MLLSLAFFRFVRTIYWLGLAFLFTACLSSVEARAAAAGGQVVLHVSKIDVRGVTVFSPEEIRVIVSPFEGHELTLGQLSEVIDRLTALYRSNGYLLSKAYLPPQKFSAANSLVTISVLEGFVDEIAWPDGLTAYRDILAGYTRSITAERPTRITTLERYMLLANRLPGLHFGSTLEPSLRTPGAARLVVAAASKPVDIGFNIDNRGATDKGPVETTLSLESHSTFGFPADAQLSVTTAPGQSFGDLKGSVSTIVNAEGLEAFVDGSFSHGTPSTPALAALMFSSQSVSLDAGLTFPWVLTRQRKLILRALMFYEDAGSDALGVPFMRDHLRGVRLGTHGELVDPWNGTDSFDAIFSQGLPIFGATASGDPLASRAGASGTFSKVEFGAQRTQPLGAKWSTQASVYGQLASGPLLAEEQCAFGGATYGRALEPSTITGDSCVMASTELRYTLARDDLAGLHLPLDAAQLYTFVDAGALYNAPSAPSAWATAADAGAGLRSSWAAHVDSTFEIATAISGPKAGTVGAYFSLRASN